MLKGLLIGAGYRWCIIKKLILGVGDGGLIGVF
jgi:hypothetical protein